MFPKFLIQGLALVLLLSNSLTTLAFRVKQGETLDYRVIIKSVIHGGNQTVRVIDAKEKYKGRAAIRIRSTVTTVGLVNKLTGYNETEEMILDAKDFYPLYLKRATRDRKGRETEEVSFDYGKKIAVRRLVEDNKPEERRVISLPGIVHDGLSLQFFLRRKNLKPGSHRLYFYSNGSGRIEGIDYFVRKVRNKLQLGDETYPEYIEIKSPKVNITILVSNDEERYPLIIRKITKVGKFEARLVNTKQL
ncbi:MAG: DUF3108 domain-containing protein [Bacillota bacterium]|jgi:hypothetical protein